MDVRKSLYKNIVISGANTIFPGFSSRLDAEVRALYKQKINKDIKIPINIVDSPNRKFSVFQGAAFLANFYAEDPRYWISKQDWDEMGVKIIHTKCQNIMI
jgi:actin-related protein 2